MCDLKGVEGDFKQAAEHFENSTLQADLLNFTCAYAKDWKPELTLKAGFLWDARSKATHVNYNGEFLLFPVVEYVEDVFNEAEGRGLMASMVSLQWINQHMM